MSNEERSSVAERYSNKVPQPLNSQFSEHVSKSVAVERYTQRKERDTTKLYPAAEEQNVLEATSRTPSGGAKRTRRPAKCRKCGKPMKGHNASACRSKP
ncbi:hypothetical protein OS493_020823 [Desmophyllum pertusum]|uniref:Uncharacterized protein n=1 Tax=Desmophyllum pertusum TaxID=174260 RepID=A0A9X0CFT9_9CNID|nr:hypothetical protein OS493_020823 [Desmophyllum pertusum]